MYLYRKLKTPVGELKLIGDGRIVECILLPGSKPPSHYRSNLKESRTVYSAAVKQLKRYFEGRAFEFTFPFSLIAGGFQKKALQALARVPYGKTISYKELAVRAGSRNAYRAAGAACASNPLPIVIPCHRVLKSDGSLGGFGGGLAMKRKLLDLEKPKRKDE